MVDLPCAFPAAVLWSEPVVEPAVHPVPLVLTDFSAPSFDAAGARQVAHRLKGSSDAVLVGEHQNRPDFPPTLLAQYLLDAGARPWMTLSCRDRNRVVLEQELRGLQLLGVDTVLCVTGDGRGYDVRPDVTQVFDLDSVRLASLAASLGLRAAVAETPSAAPVHDRPTRLVTKQHAGASVAILNHVRVPRDVEGFMRRARSEGLVIPVIAAVAVFTDAPSAAVLQGLPGLQLDEHLVRRVLESSDPMQTGIDAAIEEARELLAIEGVAGINVSGSASAAGYEAAAEVKAAVGDAIRAERRSG
jgi:5,10-methylenetetrahydrofolate reductase